MKEKISIAIDGPAAAGKSTVAKIVAKRLSYIYIDTGAMYRAITWKAMKHHIDLENEQALFNLLKKTEIVLKKTDKGQSVYVDGQDVTNDIRLPDVSNHVSIVSKHESIRKEMVARQKLLASDGGVVMDGRDIGTHVLPNAEVKIFLKASVDERAKRRHEENMKKRIPSDLEQIKSDIAKRDKLDSERKIAPLRKAHDAIEIDTTSLSIEQVVNQIMTLVSERIG
ncbi:(d)CMP kinase [Bacillus andreraoultii]|uniref:(d)CMP kinase n=1 Tax=Bacillus andreraoultii TaxID=1499685 RepID=UPI00053B980F|nr:(d)CMP kinase [Bacillus andreraoultii]